MDSASLGEWVSELVTAKYKYLLHACLVFVW
jgi:hypothetical protein